MGPEVDLAERGHVVHVIERDGVVGVYRIITHKDEVGLIGSTTQSSGQLRKQSTSQSQSQTAREQGRAH